MKKLVYISLLILVFLGSCKATKDPIKTEIITTDFKGIQKIVAQKNDTVYITNYWATWCPPCVKEIPDFVALQEEYKNNKVKFIFVNVDDAQTQADVEPFVVKHKMKNVFQISMDDLASNIGSINAELEGGIPVTIIEKGQKREGFLGDRSKDFMNDKIKEYLKLE